MEMMEILQNIEKIMETYAIVVMIVGLAEAFAGWKLFKLFLGLVGFLVGACVGMGVAAYIGKEGAVIWCVIIGGLIGAELAMALHQLGVFLYAAVIGIEFVYAMQNGGATLLDVWLGLGVMGSLFTGSSIIKTVVEIIGPVPLIAGVIIGLIAVSFEKYVVIVSTAIAGSSLFAQGLSLSGSEWDTGTVRWVVLIAGIVVQLFMEKKLSRESTEVNTEIASAAGNIQQNISFPQQSISNAQPTVSVPQQSASSAQSAVSVPQQKARALYCPGCGTPITDDITFCGTCGARLK